MELEMVLDFDVTAGTLRLQIVNRYRSCLFSLFSLILTHTLSLLTFPLKSNKKKY